MPLSNYLYPTRRRFECNPPVHYVLLLRARNQPAAKQFKGCLERLCKGHESNSVGYRHLGLLGVQGRPARRDGKEVEVT